MKEKRQNNHTESFVPKHYSILSDILYFIRFFKKEEPVVLVWCVMEIILGAIIPLFGIYLPKLTVDLVMEGASTKDVILVLGSFTLLMVTVSSLNAGVARGKYHLYNNQRINIMGMLFLKSLRVPYEYTESGEMKKVYWKAVDANSRGDISPVSRMITGTVGMITSVLCFFLYSGVISLLSPGILAAMIGLSVISYLFQMSHLHYNESLREEMAEANRRFFCVSNQMGSGSAAKDIRIFGMNDWMLTLRDKTIGEVVFVNSKIHRKQSFYEKIQFALTMIRDLGAYGFLVYQAVQGQISIGEFVLYFGAVTGLSGFVEGIMSSLSSLREAANGTDYIRAYFELSEVDLESGKRHISGLMLPIKIEFKDICFSYKDVEDAENADVKKVVEKKKNSDENMIFDHFSLTIHAGENIALVGVNGAGKTTLVKLLCGMYEPDSGEILLNGINRNEFPKKELYELFSVVFQEQLVLPFTVAENIAVDRADQVDEKRAWTALEKAGLATVFREKNIGMKTYMTKIMMKNGVELSGGQQQRFLLARALYKDAPLLVLDEPTAALDPIAESEVYESYSQYSKNKTAIFISHRLASTRFSDRIVMLENGRILEMGSHEELMRKNGAYAEMFRVQSSYYEKAV